MTIARRTTAVTGTSPSTGTTYYNIGNVTTGSTITIPATVTAGDTMVVPMGNRDATAEMTISDDGDAGAWTVTWNNDGTSSMGYAVKVATANSASAIITFGNATGSCTAGLGVFYDDGAATLAVENHSYETNASNNETHAGFTPDTDNSRIFLIVFNATNDIETSTWSSTDPGALAPDVLARSTGGNDCAIGMASANQTTAGATGNITWAQANAASLSMVFALVPQAGGSNVEVSATTDALVLTEQAATVNAAKNIQAGTDALVLTEQSATVKLNVAVSAGVDTLVLTENAAGINAAINVLAGTDALILTEQAATVDVGGNVDVQASSQALTLTEYAANINAAINVASVTQAIVLTEYAATVGVSASEVASRTYGGLPIIVRPIKRHKKLETFREELEGLILGVQAVQAEEAPEIERAIKQADAIAERFNIVQTFDDQGVIASQMELIRQDFEATASLINAILTNLKKPKPVFIDPEEETLLILATEI